MVDEKIDNVGSEETVIEAVKEPLPRMPPIQSRFLYVGVAALRAKQLRRGSLPRLAHLPPDPETGVRPALPSRLERVAMQEVEEGRIVYELPDQPPTEKDPT